MKKSILIIGFVWPEIRSSAAGARMMQLINFFLENKYDITFSSTAAKSELSENLISINVREVEIKLNDSSFDDFITKLNPSLVLFDRFMTEEQFGWRVREKSPDSILILDTEDLHFLRKAREEQQSLKNKTINLITDFTKREIASIYRCDLSLIISEYEMVLLQNHFKIESNLLLYLPYLVEKIPTQYKLGLPEFKKRKNFMTIGNFRHAPNLDSILYLKTEIWPTIRKELGNVELHIYGSYCNKKVLALSDKDTGFIIRGFAASVDDVLKNYRVSLAPLRFGAGLKGKVIDSFRNGTPCIMTSVAAEGIVVDYIESSLIDDDPTNFAEKAISAYRDVSIWERAQEIGFNLLDDRFDKNQHQKNLLLRIEDIVNTLISHRQENFIGALLKHHSMQSTKYMGKWIEEKNKPK